MQKAALFTTGGVQDSRQGKALDDKTPALFQPLPTAKLEKKEQPALFQAGLGQAQREGKSLQEEAPLQKAPLFQPLPAAKADQQQQEDRKGRQLRESQVKFHPLPIAKQEKEEPALFEAGVGQTQRKAKLYRLAFFMECCSSYILHCGSSLIVKKASLYKLAVFGHH